MQALIESAKSLSPILAQRLFTKKDPKWARVFSQAAAAGYSVPQILDFFSSKFDPSTASNENLRPDEQLAASETKRSNIPTEALKSLAPSGIGAVMALGEDSPMEDASSNLSQAEQMQEQPEGIPQQAPPQPREQPTQEINFPSWNRIKMTFPQLTSAIQQQISQGLDPASITQQLRSSRMLNSIVNQLESKHKIPMEQIVEFWSNQLGQGQQGMPQQPQPQQQAPRNPTLSNLLSNVERNMPRF